MEQIGAELSRQADPAKAALLQRFFKTGKGQYGEGDVFLGVMVPAQREIARKFRDATLQDIQTLLSSRYHEGRLTALLLLVDRFRWSGESERQKIVDLYLDNTSKINNWDLVDLSAHSILGAFLADKDRAPLYRLARSGSLWERRIAIIATMHFIKKGDISDSLKIAEMLLDDPHDLMHKAVGWVLREVCKADPKSGEAFLKAHLDQLPRTTLRYAIERFPPEKRARYLKSVRFKLRSDKMAR